jgi:type II secretory pathway pseudopilin PulG
MRTTCPSQRAVHLPSGAPRAAGFTLIEVLIASLILVAALMGIAAVLPTAGQTLHQSGQASKAVSLTQEMIEMIKNDPFDGLTNYDSVDTRTTGTYPVDDLASSPPFMGGSNVTKWANDIQVFLASGAGITNGYGTIGVSMVAADGSGNVILRKISVVVNWTESGRPYQVKLETLASGI